MIGETILHFKIIEKLGEGGMGIVYLAEDTKLKRNVAIKFLPKHIAANTEERKRFETEAQAAASLNHPNIATIHSIEQTDEHSFLVMEYVEGETIKKLIEQGAKSFTVKKVLEIAIQVCEGLNAAHEKGIVHRDIKSDNIMITPKGQVKIMDFGLAKIHGASKLTQTGSTVGTAAYMSPEQAQGEEVDARSDIFSLGVVLYEMLTTQLPFRGEHQAALLYSVVNEEPQPILRFNDKVSSKIEDIVSKSLEKNRDERYQHIDDMLTDLRKEQKNIEYARTGYDKSTFSASVTSEPNKETETHQKKRYSLKIIIPALVVVILATVFFIFNLFKPNEPQDQALTSPAGNSLAVMYFQNIPDPGDKKHTGAMLTNLLITSLSQVKGLDVISRERLLEIEKNMGQAKIKRVSPSTAIKIAKQAHVSTILAGSILQMQPKLAVTTNLINVKTGRVIGSQQLTNFTEGQIFNLVDSLSVLIRDKLQVPHASARGVKSIADVTTNSPEAYRAYVAGLQLWDKAYVKEAFGAFSRAIDMDKNFAMAYYQLATLQLIMGNRKKGIESIKKAVQLSGKVTKRERLKILALNYGAQNNHQKSIEVNNQIIKLYPHEARTYLFLGYQTYFRTMLNPKKGVKILRKGLSVNPTYKPLWNVLAYTLASLNRKAEAMKVIRRYIDIAPAEPNPYDSEGDIFAWFMETDSSMAAYRKAFSLKNDFASSNKLGCDYLLLGNFKKAKEYFAKTNYSLPSIEIYRGQLIRAEQKIKNLLKSKLSAGRRITILLRLIHLFYESDQYPQMLKYAKKVSALHKNPSYMAWALVKNGKPAQAENLLKKIQKKIKGEPPLQQFELSYTTALVEYEEGNTISAVHKFDNAIQTLPPNHEPNVFYAVSLLKSGQAADAIRELRRLVNWPAAIDFYLTPYLPGESAYWPIQLVIAHYWLGVAYEQKEEKEKAINEYKKFLSIWKDADFNSPEISDAKARLAKLE